MLEQALIEAGGKLTHRLPIISAVGGIIEPQGIEILEDHPGIIRIIEDLNPPPEPETRDCEILGALDTVTTDSMISWRLYNVGVTPHDVKMITVSWPNSHNEAEVRLQSKSKGTATSPIQSGIALPPPDFQLAPGINQFSLAFDDVALVPTQNELNLTLKLDGCEVSLPKAYEDNHSDFYFPSVVGANLLHEAGLTGDGITVAVIDSGLWNHPDLTLDTQGRRRVPEQYNAINDSTDGALNDEGGHGSHMTSIIANSSKVTRSDARGFKGIAPNARLIPVKAFAAAGDGDFLDIIRGIQWVVDNHKRLGIRVLNMSLSALPRFSYWDDPINQAVLRAWQAGIVVVAAAGNDGPDWSTVGSPGNNPYVITVGAVTDSWTPEDRTDDYIPDFSSRGPTQEGHIKPDLVAPGGHITGLVPPESRLSRENPNFILETGEFVSTGSSQAAAVVSGIVALLLEANPALTNDEIKCLLMSSAEPAINQDGRLAYSPFTQGKGYVHAGRALTLGDTHCEQQALDIDAAVAGNEKLEGPAIRTSDGRPSLPGLNEWLSRTPTEKGLSQTRRWGVREHLERLDPATHEAQAADVPVDWAAAFELERQQLKALNEPPPELQHPQ